MQIGNQFRCYPTIAQVNTLLQWIGCQRFIYNAKVREDRYFRSFARKSLNHVGLYAPIDQQYSHFKTELTPFLSEVPSQILRNGAVLWKQAYGKYFSKLASRPTLHQKHSKQSVWLTSELFSFLPVLDAAGVVVSYQLYLGTKKHPVGILKFKAHNEFFLPKTIHISIHAGRWYVSFNYDDGVAEPKEADIEAYLKQFSESELNGMAIGLDRGVSIQLAGSDESEFGFKPIHEKRMLKQERFQKRWQRRMARRTKGSRGWNIAKRKVAHYQRYAANVRNEVAHRTSYELASNSQLKLFVFEDLKVKNMTKRAKAKQDENGKFIKNGAAAKSGLNKSILESVWGKTKTYTAYKARRQGKLVLAVPPFHSSQECAQCGHVHQDNRKDAAFVCLRCENHDHADFNAAKVIKKRGIRQLLDGDKQEKKRDGLVSDLPVMGKVGTVCTDPIAVTQSTLSKISVSRGSGNTTALWSLTSETPLISQLGL